MSTQYVFVEKERNDQLQELQAFMTKKRDTLIAGSELLGYKYPSFRAAARMTPCCNLSFIPAYPDLQDDADHPRCSATG